MWPLFFKLLSKSLKLLIKLMIDQQFFFFYYLLLIKEKKLLNNCFLLKFYMLVWFIIMRYMYIEYLPYVFP